MAIHEVTYYQAKCDLCGTICDDYGEHSALADPSEAFVGLDWNEIHTVTGQEINICEDHGPTGIAWCQSCDHELPDNNWRMYGGNLIQICAHCKHPNGITLIELKDQP